MTTGRGERRRVLWVTDEPPGRDLGGGNIRQAHLVEGLAKVADVWLVVAGQVADPAVREAVVQVLEVPAGPPRSPRGRVVRRLFALWLALGTHDPSEVAITSGRRRRLRTAVADIEGAFDVVIVSHLGLAALRPPHPSARWVLQLHHVSSAKAAQERDVTSGRRQRWLLAREAAKARRFEREAIRAFDVVIAVSEEDADLLVEADGTTAMPRPLVVPNGVDTRQYQPSVLPDEPSIVMTGSLHYGPNVDGAIWFCDEVLPLVRRRVADASVRLVGHAPVAAVRALGERDGVEVHADVTSTVPWLEQARVAVVPLRIGTGTRLKALEAMAAGRPVVGTGTGLSGLGLVDGEHARVVDDPGLMAEAVAELLRDADQANRLADAGRALVEQRFDWSTIVEEMAHQLLDDVADPP